MDAAAPPPEEKPLPWKCFCGMWKTPVKGAVCRPVGPNLVAHEACVFVDVSMFDRMSNAQLQRCAQHLGGRGILGVDGRSGRANLVAALKHFYTLQQPMRFIR